jgi:hypothetical protein
VHTSNTHHEKLLDETTPQYATLPPTHKIGSRCSHQARKKPLGTDIKNTYFTLRYPDTCPRDIYPMDYHGITQWNPQRDTSTLSVQQVLLCKSVTIRWADESQNDQGFNRSLDVTPRKLGACASLLVE